ncbi:MAG: CvpA family protein [Dissulfuribacterales bacterium]
MTESFIHWNFNGLDVLLVIIGLWFVLRGFMTGIIRSVASIIGIVLGFVTAAYGAVFAAPFLAPLVQNATLALVVAFFLIFFSIYVAMYLVGVTLNSIFKMLKLGWLDMVLGGVFGLAKGLILACILVFILTFALPPQHPFLKDSSLYPLVSQLSREIGAFAPEELRGKFMWKWRKNREDGNGRRIETGGTGLKVEI